MGELEDERFAVHCFVGKQGQRCPRDAGYLVRENRGLVSGNEGCTKQLGRRSEITEDTPGQCGNLKVDLMVPWPELNDCISAQIERIGAVTL